MSDISLGRSDHSTIGWFEETRPIRGCKLSLDEVIDIYRELSRINQSFGDKVIATISQLQDETPEEWEHRKAALHENAFRLTISIHGDRESMMYGEYESIFTSAELPNPIRTIYFTNRTAWRRNADDTEPRNRIDVNLDFSKPSLFDPSLLVSEPTPNNSTIVVQADDVSYFRAVQQVIDKKILSKRTWYSAIHRPFVYDIGLWLFALPVCLIVATYYMEQWLPTTGEFHAYRWAFFVYSIGLGAILYRILTSYIKWAFPVNVLKENRDTALKHRLVLAAILSALGWKAFDAIYSLLPIVGSGG